MDKLAVSVRDVKILNAIAVASKQRRISVKKHSGREFLIDSNQLPQLFTIMKSSKRQIIFKYKPKMNRIIILPLSEPENKRSKLQEHESALAVKDVIMRDDPKTYVSKDASKNMMASLESLLGFVKSKEKTKHLDSALEELEKLKRESRISYEDASRIFDHVSPKDADTILSLNEISRDKLIRSSNPLSQEEKKFYTTLQDATYSILNKVQEGVEANIMRAKGTDTYKKDKEVLKQYLGKDVYEQSRDVWV